MTTLRVRKTTTTEAIQITSPEDEVTVRGWLEEQGIIDPHLEDLIEKKFYFMRDEGSIIVYLTSDEDFKNGFEVIEEDLGFTF